MFEPIILSAQKIDQKAPSISWKLLSGGVPCSLPGKTQLIDSSRPPLDELHPECLKAYVDHGFVDLADGSVELACNPILESRAFEQFLQDGWERLPQITMAVLVAYGASGLDRPSTAAPAIANRLPRGVVEPFTDSDTGAFVVRSGN